MSHPEFVGLSRMRSGGESTHQQMTAAEPLDTLFGEAPEIKKETQKSDSKKTFGLPIFAKNPLEPVLMGLPSQQGKQHHQVQTAHVEAMLEPLSEDEINHMNRKIYQMVDYLTTQLSQPEVDQADLQVRLAVLRELIPLLRVLKN